MIEYVPGAVLAPTAIVIVEVPDPGAGIELGLNATVVPLGTPDADRLIASLNPPLTTVVIFVLPVTPCAMLSEDGDAEILKFGPPPELWLTPRKAMGVTSPLLRVVPTTTVSCLPA